jgi:hypothetical protein
MAVIGFDVRKREPYLGGQEFGSAGAYERIDGWLRFAVDPEHVANEAIVDLKLAPRDEQGRVHFGGDLCLLLPVDAARSNRRLLMELPNRGRKLSPRLFNRAASEVPPTANILPGDGFLFRHGWTIGWIGWQWDVIRDEALMGLEAPLAFENGQPVRGTTNVRFQPNFLHQTHLLADRVHQPYPAADLEQPDAVLTVRDFDDDEPREVPRSEWRFAREDGDAVVPSAEHVYLASGFEPGRIYQVFYETAQAPVVGCGLLAVRDSSSFLRYGDAENPLAGRIDRVYGWGMSQTGRMLRHFLYLGLNVDEQGRMAYDGLNPHVGGGRRGEFNQRFGQPSVQSTPGFGFQPPHDDAGLLGRQREAGSTPKVIQTNSSAEYWRGDSALMHIDLTGTTDLPAEPDTRIYLFAATQHGPGGLPRTRLNTNDGGQGRYDFNVVDYTPLQRAALVNLDRWASDGVEPPPSAHPRLDNGTAITRAAVFDQFERLPGIGEHLPDPSRILRLRTVEMGPRADEGIPTHPIAEGDLRPSLVSALDDDGNEVGGLRMPDVAVPVATNTGWNPRDPETGAPEQILPMQGMSLFFARTADERASAHDPRPSIAERYGSRDAYLEQVRDAARALAADRYILEEDIDICVADAAVRYDEAMKG